jgi:hypothetical protein
MTRQALRGLAAFAAVATALFCAACSGGDSSEPDGDDSTAPFVVASHPDSGAANVSRSGPYWIAFSEPMNPYMVSGCLSIAPGPTYYSTSWRGDTLVITPSMLLSAGTAYTITITGTWEDTHGTPIGADCTIPFTTTSAADNTPPQVVSSAPANGAINVSGIQSIEITWSEPMDQWMAQNAVTIDPEPRDWWVQWESVTMRILHSAFPEDQLVTVTIGTGAHDLSGNHLAAPYVLSFTTLSDDTRPHLASSAPANGATEVPIDITEIELTFSEPMDPFSFEIAPDQVDARMNQVVRENPTWSTDYSVLTVPVMRTLLPGCTYWIRFWGVTDASGNIIDPNPTQYECTTEGTQTFYPVKNGDVWNFVDRFDEISGRLILDYVPSSPSGNFCEAFLDEHGTTQEVIHLRKTSSEIQHRGRSEYDDGAYQFSMMWDEAIPYIKFPLENYLGQSWNFSTGGTIDASRTMDLSGRVEIEAATVNLLSEELHGTFRGCYVHHLYVDFTIYENGIPIDEGTSHQILWLSPGVGPVQIVRDDGGGSDTLRVYDWDL